MSERTATIQRQTSETDVSVSINLDGRGQHDAATGIGSVSYTHLRAHETVLDLVCRLLLEKKKKRKKTRIQLAQTTTIDKRHDETNTH